MPRTRKSPVTHAALLAPAAPDDTLTRALAAARERIRDLEAEIEQQEDDFRAQIDAAYGEAETTHDEFVDLLVRARDALRAVLGVETLDDSIAKYDAHRVLDDLVAEVGR